MQMLPLGRHPIGIGPVDFPDACARTMVLTPPIIASMSPQGYPAEWLRPRSAASVSPGKIIVTPPCPVSTNGKVATLTPRLTDSAYFPECSPRNALRLSRNSGFLNAVM